MFVAWYQFTCELVQISYFKLYKVIYREYIDVQCIEYTNVQMYIYSQNPFIIKDLCVEMKAFSYKCVGLYFHVFEVLFWNLQKFLY